MKSQAKYPPKLFEYEFSDLPKISCGQVARSSTLTILSFGMGIAGGLGGTSPLSVSGLGGEGKIQFIEDVGPKTKWEKTWSAHKFLIPFY